MTEIPPQIDIKASPHSSWHTNGAMRTSSSSSMLRYSAVTAMIASVVSAGKWRAEIPSQTASAGLDMDGGSGVAIPMFDAMMPLATPAPDLELVRRRMEMLRPRAETNTCSEWTILGGLFVHYPCCLCSLFDWIRGVGLDLVLRINEGMVGWMACANSWVFGNRA